MAWSAVEESVMYRILKNLAGKKQTGRLVPKICLMESFGKLGIYTRGNKNVTLAD